MFKKILTVILLVLFLSTLVVMPYGGEVEVKAASMDNFKNAMLVGWCSIPAYEQHRYAQSMGFKYVFHYIRDDPNSDYDYEKSNLYKNDLKFFFNDVHKLLFPDVDLTLTSAELAYLKQRWPSEFGRFPKLPRVIDDGHWQEIKAYNINIYNAYVAAWEKYGAWVDATKSFPENLSIQQSYSPDGSKWTVKLDFQQQDVIDACVAAAVNHIKNKSEVPSIGYLCAGIVIDVPNAWTSELGGLRPLPEDESSVLHGNITHEYSKFRYGWFNYLDQLKNALESELGRDMYFIYEPGSPQQQWAGPLQ